MSERGIIIAIPGRSALELRHLILDVNGTLTAQGELLVGVKEVLTPVARRLDVHLVSADTYGTLEQLAAELGAAWQRVSDGGEKAAYLERLGSSSCVMIGNGANDVDALERAGLGICVIGPEGTAPAALVAADVVTASIETAFALLDDPMQLAATLRP